MKIAALDPEAPPALLASLDLLLLADRSAFATPAEHVDSIAERIADPERRMFWAADDRGAALGVVDLVLHSPEPGAATVSAIVVAKAARRRNGGALLLARALDSAADDGIERVVAGVRRGNAAARGFFEALGLEAEAPRGGVLIFSGPIEAVRARIAELSAG